MRTLLIILMFCGLSAYGQPGYIPFANGRPQDTAKTPGSILVPGAVRIPLYGTSDTNKVLGVGPNGILVWRTKTAGAGSGSVTAFSAGILSPLFTTSVATSTTTPALTFLLTAAGAHRFFGNNTGSTAAPDYYQPAFADLAGTIANSQLSNTGTAGTYGSATQTPVFTTDAQGRVTSVTNTTITGIPTSSPLQTVLANGDTTTYGIRVVRSLSDVQTSNDGWLAFMGWNLVSGDTSGRFNIRNKKDPITGLYSEVINMTTANGNAFMHIGSGPSNTSTAVHNGLTFTANTATNTAIMQIRTKNSNSYMEDDSVGFTRHDNSGFTSRLYFPALTQNNTVQIANHSHTTDNITTSTTTSGTGFPYANGSVISFLTGSSSQFIKADGSLDGSTYLTALPGLANGKFWVGNGSGVATAVTPSGNVTFDNAGAFTIGTAQVTNGMLAGSIAASKLVGTDINTVGTITIGTWQGSSISTTYTDAKIKTVTGTSNRLTIGGTSTDPTFDISTSYAGQATINTTGTITTGGAGTGFVIGGVTVTVGSDATGDMYYRNSSGIFTRIAPNSTATKKFLNMVSSAPSWDILAAGDIPDISATYAKLTGCTFTGGVIIPVLSINNQTGTTYTFVLGDAGKEVTSNNASAVTFTVPTNASVAFLTDTYIPLEDYGAGKLTIAAAGGVTINSDAGYLSITQYKGAYLHKTGTNTWLLIGGISN